MKVFLFFLCAAYSAQCFGSMSRYEVKDTGTQYVYKTEVIKVAGGEQKKRGKISVIRAGAGLVDLHASELLPGCNNNFPAIQMIKINTTIFPSSKKFRPEEFVVFCGNSDGKHNVMAIYEPFRGFVARLDFLEGPVNLILDQEGNYRAKVNYRVHLHSLGGPMFYSVFYTLKSIGRSVGFSIANDALSLANYKKISEESIKDFKLKRDKYVAARALLVANISGLESLYCDTKKVLKNISNDYNFSDVTLEIESTFNALPCKGEQ